MRVPVKQEIETRIDDIRGWLTAFKGFCHRREPEVPIKYQENSAEYINLVYWQTIKRSVRPMLAQLDGDRVDHHKIASTLEFCVIFCEPIDPDDPYERRRLNALLASFIAKTVILSWQSTSLTLRDISCPKFEREHVAWLRVVDKEGFPIFSNAATWYLYEQLCLAKARERILRKSRH